MAKKGTTCICWLENGKERHGTEANGNAAGPCFVCGYLRVASCLLGILAGMLQRRHPNKSPA